MVPCWVRLLAASLQPHAGFTGGLGADTERARKKKKKKRRRRGAGEGGGGEGESEWEEEEQRPCCLTSGEETGIRGREGGKEGRREMCRNG